MATTRSGARGAANTPPVDPGDISFPIKSAKAYLRMNQYKQCARRCDEAVERGQGAPGREKAGR
uniref:Uncharacterized protein n=1 Tax=Oryza brachyantha TaxID=4533 RepID=J3MKM5_ORYBR